VPAKIIVLTSDATTGEPIAPVLTAGGATVEVEPDRDRGFTRIVEHDLAILDLGPVSSGRTALELCREIRATPSMAGVPILCVASSDDVEERIGFLEAGADDVIGRPFDARELDARVEALLLRFQRTANLAPVVSSDGLTITRAKRTVAVYSPKGGVGTTTIAVNLAVAAAQHRPDKVVLVDLDLQFGGVATHLDLEPTQTLADVIRDEAALREPELLRTYAVRHDSGLHVLAAPQGPAAAELITPDHVMHILGTLLEAYESVVIDAGSTLDERALNVFEVAEAIVMPVYPEMAALKAVHALLDYLNEAGSLGAKATFVLNNMFAREILKPRDIESALGTRISADLPYDPFLYLKAVNEGVPVVIGAPRSSAAERLVKLSGVTFGQDGAATAAAASAAAASAGPQKRGGLFGLRRRT
jgi:pilus assembly protein CpaE